MMRVDRDDVLRGLRKCRRLAKQDLLTSTLTDDPAFWKTQAEARRAVYQQLTELVEQTGVAGAWRWAREAYLSLPLTSPGSGDPELKGQEQALEMFFTILGVEPAHVQAWQRRRPKAGGRRIAVNTPS